LLDLLLLLHCPLLLAGSLPLLLVLPCVLQGLPSQLLVLMILLLPLAGGLPLLQCLLQGLLIQLLLIYCLLLLAGGLPLLLVLPCLLQGLLSQLLLIYRLLRVAYAPMPVAGLAGLTAVDKLPTAARGWVASASAALTMAVSRLAGPSAVPWRGQFIVCIYCLLLLEGGSPLLLLLQLCLFQGLLPAAVGVLPAAVDVLPAAADVNACCC
jgi:hypothetical protein